MTITSYHLSVGEYRVLSLLLGVPRIVIWFAALYGHLQLDKYSRGIKRTADGEAFMQITHGLRWLALSLPFTTILSDLAGGLASVNASLFSAGLIVTHFI